MNPNQKSLALLSDVIRYRRGLGKYNFSRLIGQERDIAALEAWEQLEIEIEVFLFQQGVSHDE